ncbi:two-component system, OmpR family, sensor kinase [Pseudarthrobacter equi]|uniref:histidine kinase n=1 Tax=Pseudarthrobacter equi TaxID=728066 RepID=A0A1H1WA45_9MICC|nr:HAMP domain-containing sensor histidine kinase [Pseudarthrobacter equi]SDS93973.1 two-component system, OmpR family, sensor kinase [Pseudarthrobacter equi]SDS94073.1 two-component system, OmpR family, sensor kinase [Pseudarthrobacter equi]
MDLAQERLKKLRFCRSGSDSRSRLFGTLRSRLVGLSAAAMLVVFVLLNLTMGVLLRGYLVDEIDSRLLTSFPVQSARHQPTERFGPPDFIAARQPPDSLGAITVNGTVVQAGIYDRTGNLRTLSDPDVVAVAAAGPTERPSTLRLAAGSYRYISKRLPGDGSTAILGYSLEPVDNVIRQLTILGAVLSIGALLVAVPALYVLSGLALRSLERLTSFAKSITKSDLNERPFTIEPPRTSPRDSTEVVALSRATGDMIRNVAQSLAARERKEEQLRRFISDASHELRTPLAVIQGYAEMAGQFAHAAPQIAPLLTEINSGTERLAGLVSSMLTLARADAAENMRQESLDLVALLEERIFRAIEQHPTHSWSLTPVDDPVPFIGDLGQLTLAFDAVIDNAAQHSGSSSAIHAEATTLPDQVELSIADNGPGIPDELGEKVFEPFVTGETSRARAKSGTGLGLPIARAIFQAHHGSLTMSSRPGCTSFTIRLPLER